ncbi:hypothetical protein EHS39_36230 [Ensifer sp. MPMI2T]|nr:hypothetical protein EHS39_36230 [Ensifer sp. MPMI2T]
MDRKKILSRIVGPLPFGSMTLRWEFVSRRRTNHGLDSAQGRRFTLIYDPASRSFSVAGTRRMSKRRKREEVTVSKKLTAYLQSRLLPQHIARCTAASITAVRR